MKKSGLLKLATLIFAVVLLTSCANSKKITSENYVMSEGGWTTFYKDCALYSTNADSGQVLMYCSPEAGRTVPVCTNPNCTHDISDFPDCNAAVNFANGILKTENKLYFFDTDGGDTILYKSDLNGGNREKITTIEKVGLYTSLSYVYGEDYALYIYYDMQGLDEMEEGDFHYEMADKYKNFVDYIDLNSGEVKNILTKKDYASKIVNAVIYDDCLIYTYKYYTEDIRGVESSTDYLRYGIYSLDLKTGEERELSAGYDKMAILEESIYHFDPEKILCYNSVEKTIYFYDLKGDKFTPILQLEDELSFFTADDKDMLLAQSPNAEEYCRYNLETGEITYFPRCKEKISVECIVEDMIWVSVYGEDNTFKCYGQISKEDFIGGKYENIREFPNETDADLNTDTEDSSVTDTEENAISDEETSQTSSSQNENTYAEIDSSDYVTLKVGTITGQNTKKQLPLFNQMLHENGIKVNVEIVDLSHVFLQKDENFGKIYDVCEAIKIYEEQNGSFDLDIIVLNEMGGKPGARGTGHKLISDGYLASLDYENTAVYKLLPEKLWEAIRVKGEVYTFPYPFNPEDKGSYVYFRKSCVDEETVSSFNGTAEGLVNIAQGLTPRDDLYRIESNLNAYWLDNLGNCDEYDIQEGIVLDYQTMKAVNPFEFEPFVNSLKDRNLFYRFSDGYYEKSVQEQAEINWAICVSNSRIWEYKNDPTDLYEYCVNSVPYITNQTGVGITAASEHKGEALALLNELVSTDYREFDDVSICGLYYSEENVEKLNGSPMEISPFASYRIYYKDVEEFDEIEIALYDYYEELIKAPNFYEKLMEVRRQLKEMGIDDYVEKVNEILPEKMQYDS